VSLFGVVTARDRWSARLRMWPKPFIREPAAAPRARVVAISTSGRV
jgi:hypothetical protein